MSTSSAASSSRMTAPSITTSYPIDPNSPIFVAKAILATATAGATTGATLGVIRSANPFAYSINMGINGGIIGLTFFGLREYLVSPILTSSSFTPSHARRLSQLSEKQLGKLPSSPSSNQTAESITQIRTDRFLDSSISGFLAGGILSGGLRGAKTIISAGITSALIALGGQFVVNETRIGRLRLLAKRVGDMDETAPKTLAPSGQEEKGMISTIEAMENPTAATTSESLPGKIMAGLSHFLPVRKLSDDEYLATLEKKRADLDKRLKAIEEEEVKLYELSQSGKTGTP